MFYIHIQYAYYLYYDFFFFFFFFDFFSGDITTVIIYYVIFCFTRIPYTAVYCRTTRKPFRLILYYIILLFCRIQNGIALYYISVVVIVFPCALKEYRGRDDIFLCALHAVRLITATQYAYLYYYYYYLVYRCYVIDIKRNGRALKNSYTYGIVGARSILLYIY